MAATRFVLVTGGNKGIGYAICERLLAEHADTHVFLGARDAARGQAAADKLGASAAGRVAFVQIDVGSDASVSAAAEALKAKLGGEKLYGIVHNAGLFTGSKLSEVLSVNVRGPMRVTRAFEPLLRAEGGRVVVVSSASGPNFVAASKVPETVARLTDAKLSLAQASAMADECEALAAAGADGSAFLAKGYGSGMMGEMEGYGLSKALVNAYTLALAHERPALLVSACTPGFIETDLTRGFAIAQGQTPQEMGMKSPHEGASAPLHCLIAELPGSGLYWGSDCKRSPLHKYRGPGEPEYTGTDQ